MNYYVCIFCGYHHHSILEFRKLNNNGQISRKLFVCPSCKNVMMERTIKAKMDEKEWARYLYLAIRLYNDSNYFDKIDFDKLKYNLKKMGLARSFWEEWHDFKAEVKENGMTNDDIANMLYDLVHEKYEELKPRKTKLDNFINAEKDS